MRLAKAIVGAVLVLATFGGPAAQAGQAPDSGCTALAAASCTFVAKAHGGVIGSGLFDVTIYRGRRVIRFSNDSQSLLPIRPPIQIRPGDRVTLYAGLTWIGVACVGAPRPSFVRAGSESNLLSTTP